MSKSKEESEQKSSKLVVNTSGGTVSGQKESIKIVGQRVSEESTKAVVTESECKAIKAVV